MKRLTLAAAAGLATVLATTAAAGDRRHAAAHQHGHGKLNIAVDGDKAVFEMRVPGADIIGFEHAASTGEEKTKLAAAKEILGDPQKIFTLPGAAGCTINQSFVHYTKDPEHAAHHEPEHSGNRKETHHTEHHGMHEDGHAGHQPGHAEFHLGFELTCLSPENLTSLTLGYFDHFANAQSLEVNIVTAKGQSQVQAARDNPTIDLGAKM